MRSLAAPCPLSNVAYTNNPDPHPPFDRRIVYINRESVSSFEMEDFQVQRSVMSRY